MLRRFIFVLSPALLLLLLAGFFPTVASAAPQNVLFLFSDDQRADTIHALGNAHIETPHLDRLVQRGTAFPRAYCMGGMQGAVCVPSRAMLLTGRPLWRIHEQLKGQQTWPETFAAAGYATFLTGKWHNGRESLLRIFPQGRAIFLGGMGDPFHLPLQDIIAGRTLRPHATPPGRHAVEEIADAAIGFLRDRPKDKPFLLHVALEAPHDPRVAPPEYHARYKDKLPPLPPDFLPLHPFDNGEMTIRDERLAPWPRTEADIRAQLADYYALITYMDAQIGRILEALEKSGAADETLIVFASDQGLALGSHGLMGKQNLYESGMRVPLIFAGPGIPAGEKRDALCYLTDVYTTLGDLTGTPRPDGCEGRSLAPVIAVREARVRSHILTGYRDVQRAITDGTWKLIRYPQVDVTQLFNLSTDPHEMKDVSGDHSLAPVLERLTAALKAEQGVHGDTQQLTVDHPRPSAWTPPAK